MSPEGKTALRMFLQKIVLPELANLGVGLERSAFADTIERHLQLHDRQLQMVHQKAGSKMLEAASKFMHLVHSGLRDKPTASFDDIARDAIDSVVDAQP